MRTGVVTESLPRLLSDLPYANGHITFLISEGAEIRTHNCPFTNSLGVKKFLLKLTTSRNGPANSTETRQG